MNTRLPLLALTLLATSCTPSHPAPTSQSTPPSPSATTDPTALQSLHVRLEVSPATGDVTYFGWYDGRRNLLGPAGITTAIVGTAPPELRGQLKKPSPTELLYTGIDQNQILWTKRYRLADDHTIAVTLTIQNRGDRPFDAILYALTDLPDATITGDNRDQHIRSPLATAHFHADVANPHFPGEQMNPSALRSDSKHLDPGDTMTFTMTWQLQVARTAPQ